MNKKQFEAEFKYIFSEMLSKRPIDWAERRETWNNYVDALHRQNRVTDKQAQNWDHPEFIEPKN